MAKRNAMAANAPMEPGPEVLPIAEPAGGKGRRAERPRSVRAERGKCVDTAKATIVMERKLHWLLHSIASYLAMDASALAAELIKKGLREKSQAVYDALDPFKPKKFGKAKSNAPADTNDRSSEGSQVRPEGEDAA